MAMSSKRLVFLCSGGGGNLRFIHGAIAWGILKGIELAAVIADRECGALKNARDRDLPALLVPYGPEDRSSLKRVLHEHHPDLIVSTFHKILDPDVVRDFKGKIINLHYSLLPLFKRTIGTAPVEQALAAGCRFLGTTVHFVTEDVDGGPIVSQSVIPVAEGETVTAVMDRVFRSGCLNLLNALRIATERGPDGVRGSGSPTGRNVFSPPLVYGEEFFPDRFWSELR
jgi:phosphoribosylglycinamide formyltransferase-1